MRLTFYTEIGQSYVVEIDPQMELENIMALLEAEVKLVCRVHQSASSNCAFALV
jgi:hypothetical protein